MIHHFILKEAIASVSIEHGDTCECVVCRAADGDEDALYEIYKSYTKNNDERRE